MAFTYRQVKDLYDTLASSGAVTKSLPDWSNEMNDLTGSDLYAEGLHDNLIKRASVGIDRGLEAIPGLISGGESLGRGVGSLFGMGDQGAAIGADLPRQTLNFLPMIAAGAVTGGAAPLAMAAGLAGTAGLTGAHTYTQTDSPAAGVISGATAALFPTAAKFGEQATLRALGGRLVEGPVARGLTSDLLPAAIENVSERFATNPVQSGLSFLGGQAAALGLQGGANVVQSGFTGEDVQNPVSGEGLLGLALGQLPFSALHLAGKAFPPSRVFGDGKTSLETNRGREGMSRADLLQAAIDSTRRGMVIKEAKDALANQTDNSKPVDIPVIPPSETVSQETAETLAKIRGEKAAITSQEVISPEDIEKLNTLNQAEDAATEFVKPTADSVLGAELPPDANKFNLVGKQISENAKSRTVLVSDHPDNPEEYRGRMINYSKGKYETLPTEGENGSTFAVPQDWHQILPERKAKIPAPIDGLIKGKEGETQESSKPQVDFHSALDLLDQQVSSATSTADMQKVVRDLQGLKAQGLFPDTNDIRLKSIVQRIAESGLVADPAKAAVRSEVAKTKRQVDNQSQAIDRLEHSTAYQLDLENRRHDVDDPVAKGIYNLRQNFSNRSGRYEKAVSSGLFDEVAARWEKEGGTDLEELKQQFEPIIKKGTGLKKVLTPVADEIQEKVKTSPDSTPVKSIVTEATYKAITAPDTAKAFASSERVQGSNLDFEKRQFIDWVNEMGGISEEDIPDMAEYFAHRDAKAILGKEGDVGTDFQGLQNEITDDLRHFYESPHVQLWKAELDKVLVEAKEHKPKLQGPKEEIGSNLPAGGGFVWSLAPYDSKTNRIGGKHTLPKGSVIAVGQLKAIGGRGKFLNDAEIDMMRAVDSAVGGGAFNGDKVNVKVLDQVLKENPIQIELKKFGDRSASASAKGRIGHQLDTEFPGWDTRANNGEAPRNEREAQLLHQYDAAIETPERNEAESRYSFLGPKSEQEMPGYVEGLVSIFVKKVAKSYSSFLDANKLEDSKASRQAYAKFQESPEYNNIKYRGPHFGSEDTNVLAFFRGYEETLPDGTKAFHVIEVQSDWGQSLNHKVISIEHGPDAVGLDPGEKGFTIRKQTSRGNEDSGFYATKEEADKALAKLKETKGHPLLPAYETLALKAAIDHANALGISKIILPDAETAMMTEGHDKVAQPTFSKEAIGKWTSKNQDGKSKVYDTQAVAEANGEGAHQITEEDATKKVVSQSGGMTLHYDTTLPSAMRKLTGDKGEAVDLGVHKGALGDSLPPRDPTDYPIVGSPVFKNPDGTPKSSITGKIYDLSKIQSISKEQGGLTLGDPSRAPKQEEPEVYIPQTKKSAAVAASLTGDGHAILNPVLQSQIPLHRDIAATLVKNFPDALRLVSARVVNADASETQGFAGRRSEITFEPSAVTTNAEKREQLILHEVIHGLTLHELDNPASPELVANINDIRARAIVALPKGLKADFDRAIATDFITRNSADSGNSVWMDLSPTKEGRQILYGLLNHYEFTAQAFSSPEFQSYLKSIPGKVGGWRKFVESIKSALGLSTDNTLLSEVISHTGQLMRQGNYIASLQNFGERWFEDQGKGGLYGRLQTERALGLAQEMVRGGVSRAELVSSLGSGESEVNPRLTQVKQKLDETFSSDPELANHMTQALAENGHETGTKGFDGLTEEAIADGRDLSNTLAVLPPEATDYIFEKLRDHRDVLSMLKAASSPANDGLLNILDVEPIRAGSADMLKQIGKVLKIGEEHISIAQELSKLAVVEPRQLMTASAQAPKAIEDFMEGTSGVIGKVGSSIARFLEPIGQLVRRFPEAAELAAKGFQLVPNARRATTERLKPLAADMTNPNIDVVDKTSLKANEKVISNPKMLKAINQWMHLNQIGGKDAVQLREVNDPEVAKILQNLSPEEKSQVRDMIVKAGKVTQYGHAQNLENMTQEAAIYGAGLIGKDTGLPTAGNLKLSDTLLRAVLDIQDPMKQLIAEQQLQTVQQQLANQPDTFLALLKYSQDSATIINGVKEHYAKNPYWATAQRMEQYLINGFKNGKPWLGQASSIKEGKEIALKLGISLDKNNPFTDQWRGKEDNSFQAPNMSPDMARRLQELEKNQVSMLVNRGLLTTEEVPEFLRTSAVGQFLKESDASQSLQGIAVPPRQLSKGAEDLPYLWNHIAHAQRESTYWSRRILRAQVKTYLNDPTWTQNDGLRSQLATHFDNLLQSDPQVAQKMTRFASTWFMGFNLASTLVNATQPFLTHVAELTAMSGKPIDSYVRIGRALKEAVGDKLSGKHQWATEEHNRFMKDAALDSERGLSMLDDAEQQEESVAVNFMRQMKKDKIQTVGQKLGTAAGTYSQVGMWTFRQVEQINATAALLASFDYHREQGLSYDQAKAKAYEFNHAVNFSGGRAQRSVGAFSGRGPFPRTVAMLGTSLQSYVLGTTSQIGRYLQQGLFRPQGLQPHEVYNARKAAIQMLGTQFAAAGLLGLPFASSAIALLNQMFPDLELNKKIREGVNGFLSSDKDNGSSLTDIAMTGVPSMLGWDMQSRLSMGNTLPGVSEINGFQPQNLMGPVGNIIRNFVQGVQGWGKGELSSGSSFLPPAIKKTLETANSFLTDGGAVRDYQGRPIADPTMGEQIGRALGFQPKRLSDQNAAAHIAKQSQDVASTRESQERQELATQTLKGNFGTVRSHILQRMQSDKSYNPQDAIRSIAQSAEDLNFPRDLRREGTSGTATARQSLLSSYSNLSPSGPSEMDRLNFRSTIERGLGLVSQDRSAMASAQLMDQLKSANPQLTRVQLKALAQSQLRRSAPGNFSLSPE